MRTWQCRYLKMLTFLPLETIHSIEADMQRPSYQPNLAQRKLAEEVIRFVHGEEGVAAALSATQVSKPPLELKTMLAGLLTDIVLDSNHQKTC